MRFFVYHFSDISASLWVIAKSTSSSKVKIVLINNIVVMVEELILINRHSIFSKLRRFIAFPRISASISNHNTLKIDSSLSLRQLVLLKNLSCQERYINSCITLSWNIELIILQFRKFSKKIDQSIVIVISHRIVIISVVDSTFAETNSSRTFQI